MTPEEIAKCFMELKSIVPPEKNVEELIRQFLLNPGKIEMDNHHKDIIKSTAYKKLAVAAHPDRTSNGIYMNAMDEYIQLSELGQAQVKQLFNNPSATPTPPQQAQEATRQQASQKPGSFTTMFQSFSFEKAYREAEKLSLAQKLHLHNYVREEQVQLLDTIEKFLLDDGMANDAEHAQIFHGVLHLMQDNLKKEFRWMELIGLPKKSRLEDIVERHIKQLSTEFPEIQKDATKESLMQLVKDKNLIGLDKKIDQLLKPHGFLDAVKEFVKHGLASFQAPKQKP